MSYTAQIQRSPALFDANPSATCVNITDSLPDMGGVVPSPSKGASMNGILLAILITVAVVVWISVLIAVVLFVYTRDHSRQNIKMRVHVTIVCLSAILKVVAMSG